MAASDRVARRVGAVVALAAAAMFVASLGFSYAMLRVERRVRPWATEGATEGAAESSPQSQARARPPA